MSTSPASARAPAADASAPPGGPPDEDRALRELATRQVERLRSFRIHLISYLVVLPLLGVVWVVTEYVQADGWPSRWSDSEPGGPGVWNPWWFYAFGIWSVILAVHAAKTYGHRPPTEDEIQREIDRIRARR